MQGDGTTSARGEGTTDREGGIQRVFGAVAYLAAVLFVATLLPSDPTGIAGFLLLPTALVVMGHAFRQDAVRSMWHALGVVVIVAGGLSLVGGALAASPLPAGGVPAGGDLTLVAVQSAVLVVSYAAILRHRR